MFCFYIAVYKCIINDINDKHPIPIPTNHSIILCKNGYKIGKTGWFSLFGTVLLLPDTPMLPPLTPGCTSSLHPDVKDGNMGGVYEIMCLSLLKKERAFVE